METAKSELGQAFEAAASPPALLRAESYRRLLESLLCDGKGFGKVKPVAAYMLRNMRLVTQSKNAADQTQEIGLPDLYVIMDPAVWPNEYIRRLGMEDIAVQWSKRVVGEGELNGADFKGPGIWTAKKNSFEQDYLRRDGADEDGRPLTLYDPNPDAYRICLPVNEPVTIPTAWGTPYPIGTGGAVAVRERDVPALTAALQSIRDGETTAAQALYTQDKSGKTVARFDVYGMEPKFLKDNYDPVDLKADTQERLSRLRALPPLPPEMPVAADEAILPPALAMILAKYNFDTLPKDGAVFWAEGGVIVRPEDRTIVPVNDELAQSFMQVNNALQDDITYTDMLQIVDKWNRGGSKSQLLPRMAKDISYHEENEFWRQMNVQFAGAATGAVHIAAANAGADSVFRLFTYPAIMANDKITQVQAITGRPQAALSVAYVDTLTKKFERAAAYHDWRAKSQAEPDRLQLVYADMIQDEALQTMPKDSWAERQKQDWFDTARAKLMCHLNNEPVTPELEITGAYFNDRSRDDFLHAKIGFVEEIIFSLREIDRLKTALVQGKPAAASAFKAEKQRLKQSRKILQDYPEILHFDEAVTPLEWKRSFSLRHDTPRAHIMTQQLGSMLMGLDTSLTLEEKNAVWGRYETYSREALLSGHGIDWPAENLGQPRKLEVYVRSSLAGLKNKIDQALEAGVSIGVSIHRKL
jgi:hypothetical protein